MITAEDSRTSKKKSPAQSAARPPTDSIYPVQAPYADLQGLTPPPDDFGDFLRDCPPLSIPSQYNGLVEPPTPPRTEAVSSPSRSSQSEGSSIKAPSSPDSDTSLDSIMYGDATMHNVDDLGRVVSSLMQGTSEQLFDTPPDPMSLDPLEKFFDFNSAASSPKPSPNVLPRSIQLAQQQQQQQQKQRHHRTQQQSPFAQSKQYQGSSGGLKRPRGDMDTEFDFGSLSPSDVKTEFPQGGNLNCGNLIDYKIPTSSAQVFGGFDGFQMPAYPSPSHMDNLQPGATVSFGPSSVRVDDSDSQSSSFPYELTVEFPKSGKFVAPPDPRVKSRVETQIAVRFGLTPIPDGVAKLRLPRHAIAKTKYIEDDHPQKSPEILELSATLVCASAMHKKDQRVKALCEARGAPVPDWIIEHQHQKLEGQRNRAEDAQSRAKADPDMNGGSPGRDGSGMPKEERKEKIDYSHGLYGAPVQICDPCINRERKRASRKKHKKPEEEEKWALDETKRIIVFNTNQVRQLERPQGAAAVYAETQMRICCYCRHHGEKEGFQVIFTVKDHLGAVVAQTISSTILITDDHKNTHATAAPMMHQDGAMASHPDQAPPGQAPPQVPGYPQGFVFHQPQPTHDVISNYSSPPASAFSTSPRIHHGSTPPSPMRTSSRSPGVHESKRRRGGKVPASLAMTPSEPSTHHRPQFDSTGINFSSRNAGAESRPPQWMAGNNGPVSPMALTNDNFFNDNGLMWGSGTDRNGFNNLLNSPPTSNIAPTVSTPMSGRQLSTTMQSPLQQQAALQLPDQQQQVQYTGPLVSRVVPSEGTCRGGIEITVLGQSFHNGLTVMFGDVSATDTFYFSDSTLLCRLPPNPNPGPVVVSLKNYPPFAQGPNVSIFTYVDDVEKELMALALTVVGMKMKGELGLGTHKQIALSILRENGIGTEAIERGRNNMGNQRGAELEQTLLTLLDVIDMDESPHPASLGHKNKSGQAMLHLASMLGMQKFVAALLARGVNANSRDKNGYTPLHFAVLFKRSDVIRRLVMNGANVGIRTRGGQTPTDLGESDQIAKATRGIQQAHSRQHSRSSSVSSEIRFSTSRSGSITSLAAGLPGMTRGSVDDYFAPNSEDDSSDLDYTSSDEEPAPWRSRKGSVQNAPSKTETSLSERGVRGGPFGKSEMASTVNATDSHLSPPAIMAAWMEAWREQLTQSFQNLQLSMPAMPTAQTDYQTLLREQMAKFQYQVPAMPAMPRWGGFGQQRGGPDYKWSELLHPPAAPSSPSDPAPPAYDELYPDGNAPSGEAPEKVQPMVQSSTAAATETSELRRRASPLPEPSSSKHALREIQRKITRRDHTPTEAEQAEYRAQIQKLQRIQNDRRLYFFWIPVLVFIMLAMAYTHGPRAWSITKQVVGFAKQVIQEPTVVRERVRMGLVQALGAPV